MNLVDVMEAISEPSWELRADDLSTVSSYNACMISVALQVISASPADENCMTADSASVMIADVAMCCVTSPESLGSL